jgi:arginine N-succinyltransferase
LLRGEGFHETDLVDIFDGGPTLECDVRSVDAVQRCRVGTVVSIEKTVSGPTVIASSMHGGFAAVLAPTLRDENDGVSIETATALALGLKVGDRLWTLAPYPPREQVGDTP